MNSLSMVFVNKAGRNSTFRIPKVRTDVTELEIQELMNLLITKNVLFEGDQELESIDSAVITRQEAMAV